MITGLWVRFRKLLLQVRFHVKVAEEDDQRNAICTDHVQKDWREITLIVKSDERVNDDQNELNLTKGQHYSNAIKTDNTKTSHFIMKNNY